MTVNGPSTLTGQVIVNANMDSQGTDGTYTAYPLLVQGSKQGIAIKVNGNRNTSNNYISLWDDNQMWGRIEGQTHGDLWSDPEHILETANLGVATAIATVDFAIAGFEVTCFIFQYHSFAKQNSRVRKIELKKTVRVLPRRFPVADIHGYQQPPMKGASQMP